ncbi:MAG TPA: hypothetical protein VF912_06810, partial [Anaeromyxobacter sp.]
TVSSSAEIGLVGQETEVTAKARRRQFTAEYKLKVLAEAEACTKPGEILNGTVTFTYDTRVVVDGNHQFRANAVDVLGLRGTSGTRFLRVDNTAPVSDATAPYSATWDPKGATYGTHVLTAVASDTAGNTATSAVTVWGK